MKVEQISEKLQPYAIEDLGRLHRFNLRKDAKVSALSFVVGFFHALHHGYSLRAWACGISRFLQAYLSKSGLQKRFQSRQVRFCKALLDRLLRQSCFSSKDLALQSGWFSTFRRVYLEDSTCVSLSSKLAAFFPGSYSHRGQSATARIQLSLELKTHRYKGLNVGSFRQNDQSYSRRILRFLRKGDLVIRDKGYWVLKVFAKILRRGAYLLSRYRYGTNLYEAQSGKQLDLAPWLKAHSRAGRTVVDIAVEVGKKDRVPLRLVAVKVPEAVANERIRKAKKERNKKANHSEAYYQTLQWNLFLTNVPPEVWKAREILQVYGLRWRIEIIFKVWKSKFGLQKSLKSPQSPIEKVRHAYIFLYLFLCYLLLFYVSWYAWYLQAVYQHNDRFLSSSLFVDFLKERLSELLEAQTEQQLQQFVPELADFYTHERRKSRASLWEQCYRLSLTYYRESAEKQQPGLAKAA